MTKTEGERFGPGPNDVDPYAEMSTDEFVAEAEAAFAAARRGQRPVSIRLPEPLIVRAKEQARRHGLPYQTLMKVLIERGLDNLEKAS